MLQATIGPYPDPLSWSVRSRWQRATGRKSLLDKLGGLILVGGILANLVVTLGLTFVSVNNYPGGEAMRALRSIGAATGRNGENRTINGSTGSMADV